MSLRIFHLPGRDQEIGEFGVGFVVVGSQFDGAGEFLIGVNPVVKIEISLAQLKMGLRETGIDLHGVGVLDGGFAVFALAEVALSALKIFLLANVGIARAAGEHGCEGASRE